MPKVLWRAAGWGNLPQYYLATYVDTETGKKLDSPKVTVVKVNTELSKAPQVKFAQTDNGEARFYWEEVPGASDSSYVADAFAETQYQNPLILGIQKASMDTDNMILLQLTAH